MFLHFSVDFPLIVISDLFTIFLVYDGADLPLPGIYNNFLISPGSRLFTLVEMTNNSDSLLSAASSVITASLPASLLSTINPFNN